VSRPCVHADHIREVPPPGDGCETCLETGDSWVHLRQCLTCGRTLCCDDSPNRHMSKHGRVERHPVMRTAEPDEAWTWCFEDDALLREGDGGWQAFDWYVERGIEAARAHLSSGIAFVAPLPASVDGFDLGEWAAYVRRRHAEGTLDADDEATIAKLPGWTWQGD